MSAEQKENVYKNLLDTLNAGEKAVIITKITQDKNKKESNSLKELFLYNEEKSHVNNSLNPEDILLQKAQYSLETGNLQFLKIPDADFILFEPYFPEPQLIVLGGGHIAKPLVEFAAKVGFRVAVADDRPSFANIGRFPLAEKVICESFENCFKLLNFNNSSFVVIVTRGHKHDMFCLKETLKHNTAYVGMIGSKRRINIVFEQLSSEGYSQEQIKNVNAPIGLEIDAVTPEEIAVSILAQVISFKRKNKTMAGKFSEKVSWPEFDRIVIDELAKGFKVPKAIVTVISTKGSVPRKAGAKMIVFPDGRTLGSIGGGCSEGEVIKTALDIIRSGGCHIQKVDMTGYVAEEEGMVCGGVMEVVIEFSDL